MQHLQQQAENCAVELMFLEMETPESLAGWAGKKFDENFEFFILQLVYILPDTRRNQELAPCFSALQVARGSSSLSLASSL